jgi:hypothetical protein
MKRYIVIALALTLLSGCASEGNRQLLASYQRGCFAGDPQACEAVPVQQAINSDEAASNSMKVLGALLLIPLVALAAASASQPDYVVYVPYRHR